MLKLNRPLVVFDLETTGTNVAEDRIVEIALVVLEPAQRGSALGRSLRSWLVNPGRPIPPQATAVHGITDADVADAPSFAELAAAIHAAFEGADLSGFHAERFDIPLLAAEFKRVGLVFPAPGTHVLDSHTLFVRQQPRDLAAAVATYCGRSHEGAHRAEADALAAADVLLAQLQRDDGLPREVAALHELLHPGNPAWIDTTGKLAWHEGRPVLTFGKHRQRPLQELVAEEPDYLRWVLSKDFPEDTRQLIAEALEGRFPGRS